MKKLIVIIGLSVLFTGCSTSGYFGDTVYNDHRPTSMGVRYLLGRGVLQSDEKAFGYFSQAARDGDAFAQNELGYMYAAGKGTSRDEAKSIEWYTKAAEQGLASAQYNLGLMYLYGMGTAPNRAVAKQWFQQSAAHGFEPARFALQKGKL